MPQLLYSYLDTNEVQAMRLPLVKTEEEEESAHFAQRYSSSCLLSSKCSGCEYLLQDLTVSSKFKEVAKACLVEAKWREEGYIAPLEEYMKNALVSSTYPMLTTNSYIGMEIASKEAFDWISTNPNMLVACTIVCRVMDDIITHEFERERVHVYSAVESYMKEHGVSREEAIKYFRKEIANAWKVINEGCMKPTTIPMPLRRNILNLTRAIDVVYKDADAYSNSYLLKDHIASLLVNPFPL